MIIAWGLFVLGAIFTMICITPLIEGLSRGKAFAWDFKPFLISILIVLCSAQYIWG